MATTLLLCALGFQVVTLAVLVALLIVLRPLVRALLPLAPLLVASAAWKRTAEDLHAMATTLSSARAEAEARKDTAGRFPKGVQ